MKLVDNATRAYRMFSIQALAVIASAQGVLALVPADKLAGHVPLTDMTTWADVLVWLSIVAAALGAFGRLVDQTSTKVDQS